MSTRNKSNKYPFIILLAIHSALLVYTFYKNKDRKRLFVLLFSTIGIGYLFEYIVVNLFNGYRYKPSFLKNKELDNIVGAILSQAIFTPFTALFITAFQLGWKVKLFFSLYFTLIEMIFLRIGVYKHNWWKAKYTMLLLPIYFHVSDKWYQHLKKGTPIILFFSLYHLILVTCVNLLFVRAIKGKVKFGWGIFHTWREHFKLGPLYSIILSLITTWTVKGNTKKLRVINLVFRIGMDFILTKMKWIKTSEIPLLTNLPIHLIITIMLGYYRDLVYKK